MKKQTKSSISDKKEMWSEAGLEGVTPKEELQKTKLDPRWPFIIHIIPQAHIDLAWEWTWIEAIEMILETFRGHAQALEADTSRTYAQSQLAAYWIVEQEDPALFERIRRLVKKGQWEIVGGEWVEPDNSIPSGESRIRQLLIGQLYAYRKFGKLSKVAWCPDSFTHYPGNLPQILRGAGLKFLALKRPREKFIHLPITPFYWRAFDGSEILSYRSNNKGFAFPLVSEGTVISQEENDLTKYAKALRQIGLKDLWGPLGVGDVGGINIYDKPSKGQGWCSKYSIPEHFFKSIVASETKKLPVIKGDIGPIMTGCLTTHSEMKWLNRLSESRLALAEFLDTASGLLTESTESTELDFSWKRLLFNQFHDVICGVGVPEVHSSAVHDYKEVIRTADDISRRAARLITARVNIKNHNGIPVAVFNSLGWKRTDVVKVYVDLCADDDLQWQAVDSSGNAVPVSFHSLRQYQKKWQRHCISFVAIDVPSMGYKIFNIIPDKTGTFSEIIYKNGKVQTPFLKAYFNQRLCELTSLKPAWLNHSLVPEGKSLGKLLIHEEGEYQLDYNMELRAWYLGLTGKVEDASPQNIEIAHRSPGTLTIRTIHTYGKSKITQNFTFRSAMERIDVDVNLDWNEVEHLLRLHFPLKLKGHIKAMRDEPYAYEELPLNGIEHPMQYWCDMTGEDSGLAVLNFGRYGCSAKQSELALSAIRCATYPDPISDKGRYSFRYALLPHRGDYHPSFLMRHGYSFNHPLYAFPVNNSGKDLSEEKGLFESLTPELLPVVLKRGVNRDTWIIRSFHCSNKSSKVKMKVSEKVKSIYISDLLERSIKKLPASSEITLDMKSQKISTCKIKGWKLLKR